MPAPIVSEHTLAAQRYSDEIGRMVQELKDERDAWNSKAIEFKALFYAQTSRLQESITLCAAVRAELEHERTVNRQLHHHLDALIGNHATKARKYIQPSRHSAAPEAPAVGQIGVEWQPTPVSLANFGHVERLIGDRKLPEARNAIECALPGSLSNEARVEGLLLKSAICRASGPDWVLEGLAQCSEALALCNNISELEFLLPRIQYHRSLCHSMLKELSQAREALSVIASTDKVHEQASEYRRSCDELQEADLAKRRSAFDEYRTEGYPVSLNSSEKSRWRLSRSKPCITSSRPSLPHRWLMPKSMA